MAQKHSLAIMVIALALPFFFMSCSSQQMFRKVMEDPAAFQYQAGYEYQIRKNDKISISVWDHDDLSIGSIYGIYNSNEVYGKWLLVDAAGEVTVPKLGNIKVEGLTLVQAKKTLRDKYSQWVVNPIVEVKVLNKEVTAIGEFKTPGQIPMEEDYQRLVDVIGKAGDFDFYANKKAVKVIRQINGESVAITIDMTRPDDYMAQQIQILPGDVIYAPSRKGKQWDKKAGSVVVPATSIVTALVVVSKLFL